jgi:ribulose-5-phosphate 4-epimerase/fuculose-1-phosphate aldolase
MSQSAIPFSKIISGSIRELFPNEARRPLPCRRQGSGQLLHAHGVYEGFGGCALPPEEGENIARALGNGEVVILQNHGILAVAKAVDGAHVQLQDREIIGNAHSWGCLKL